MFVTLPADEETAPGEKGKSFQKFSHLGRGNRYRNLLLIAELSILIIQALFLLLDPEGYFEFVLNFFLMGYPLNIIFAAFFMAFQWQYLNRIKEGNLNTPIKDKVLWGFMMSFFFLGGIYALVTGEALPFPFGFAYIGLISSAFIDAVFLYLLMLYWERKNLMTIYLIEGKPIALPAKA